MAQSTQAVTYAEPVAQTHTQVQQGRSPRLVSTDVMQGGACMWALQTLWPACQCVGCMPHTACHVGPPSGTAHLRQQR